MTDHSARFSHLQPQKPDALLALISMHRADPRTDKIDVGVGVYRDDDGHTPVMRAVKAAEARLLTEQSSKSYLGPDGDIRFADMLAELVFGPDAQDARRFGLQTPGGTGALRVGAELIARATPHARIWMSQPTWPNHAPIFSEAGLAAMPHPYLNGQGAIAFDAMVDALAQARADDVILLHGCCHNPTGTQFDMDQWASLSALCNARGLIPFIDLAYQGLGDGLAPDAAGARLMFDTVPTTLLAYSCDKNFALYRDRVGPLFVQTPDPSSLDLVRSNILALSRSLWSMPPDHGAAVVRMILDDRALAADWRCELDGMRGRLNAMRATLAAAHPLLAPVASQRGLFSRLPVDAVAVDAMRASHGIYMPTDGRINMAGLNDGNMARFVDGLLPHLDRHSTEPADPSRCEKALS